MKNSFAIGRRTLLKGAGAAACASLARPSWGQASIYPKGPVRFIVPFTAGGAADVATRPLAIQLEQVWKQSVIVDNKPGGLFMIGLQTALQAPADGHTLMYLTNSMAAVQAVHKRYDLNQQVVPVTQTVGFPMVMLVPGNSPFKTVQDLVSFARANPSKLRYSSVGMGSTEHLKALEFERIAGFQALHVPYKSGPDMVKGLIGGEVDFQLTAVNFAHAFAPKGLVRVLALTGSARMKDMPEVLTLIESGIAVSPFSYWSGYAVRAGTPTPIIQQLYRELAAAAVTPPMTERLVPIGMAPVVSSTSQEFAALIASEVAWAGEQSRGLKLD